MAICAAKRTGTTATPCSFVKFISIFQSAIGYTLLSLLILELGPVLIFARFRTHIPPRE
jgi:hypothetical protein